MQCHDAPQPVSSLAPGWPDLRAARSLTAAGHDVTIIDKGRGVGGADGYPLERYPEGVRAWYDHGAQFFTVRSDQVFRLRSIDGVQRDWCSSGPTDSRTAQASRALTAIPGMPFVEA
jgi:predicted NAD/FAD-dependent oxidoreductase